MSYALTITDNTDSMTIPMPGRPLTESIVEGATEVTTMDMNVYTDFFGKKRVWEDTIDYMSNTDFLRLRAFYDRQFTQFRYPTLTITSMSVNNVPVRMKISSRKVVDTCGGVEDVTINLRETIQMSPGA